MMQSRIKPIVLFAAVLVLSLLAVLLAATVSADVPDGYHEISVEIVGGDSTCKITWTGSDVIDDKYCKTGIEIKVNVTVGAGYELTKVEWTDGTFAPGETTATINAVTKDLHFKATFSPKTYKISYSSNQVNASITTLTALPSSYTYGSDAIELYKPSDTAAYEFVGWFEGNNEIKPSTDGKYWYKPNAAPTEETISLTARFEPKAIGGYREDYDYLTGTLLHTEKIVYNDWVYGSTVTANGDLKDPNGDFRNYPGYTFLKDDSTYYSSTVVSATQAHNVVKRYYVPNEYKVTFDSCGGTFEGNQTVSVTFNQALSSIAAADLPERDGYRFAGFYTQPDGRGVMYIAPDGSGSVWNIPSNTTLYAYWVPQAFQLTCSNALTDHATITVKHGSKTYTYDGTALTFDYGSTVTITVTASDGYKLVVWNGTALTSHAKTETFSFTIPAKNTELSGTVLPVCATPTFTVDYVNELLTADGGIPAGNYLLRVGETERLFSGTESLSLSEWFGKTVEILCKGDGVQTADSEWFTLALAARPQSPILGEGGTVEKPSATENSVTFTVTDGETIRYEYAYALRATDKLVWRDTGTFENLSAGTTYTFYIRLKATETAPHGESLVVTVYTLNENYLRGKIEELRAESQSGDGSNVSDLITIYVTRMEALQPSADYEAEIEALLAECRIKLALARYKDTAIATVEARRAELLAAKTFNAEGEQTLSQVCATAIASINEAATTTGVDNALRAFETAVAEIPVRIDLTNLLIALGVVIFCQVIALAILLSRHAKYADRVKFARGKNAYGFSALPLPTVALTAQFLPEQTALVALLLGVVALVLQVIIMVLLFRSIALKKRPQGESSGNATHSEPSVREEPDGADREAFRYQPQTSVFADDAPTFEGDSPLTDLQEEDWYDEDLAEEEEPTAPTFESDDSFEDEES